jgi:hypothetical protein
MKWDYDDPLACEYFDDVEAIKETDLALLCVVDGEEIWIPKSVIDNDSEVQEEGDSGVLSVKEWFARKEM